MSDTEGAGPMAPTADSFGKGLFTIGSISLAIAIDILQYSMPLPFLSTDLEDFGHSTLAIALSVGGYYWMGFLGGLCITARQFYRVMYEYELQRSVMKHRLHVTFLIAALAIGSITLVCQYMWPGFNVHLISRLLQGFIGAFLFFYSYLLSIELFTGHLRIVALTCTSCSLNTAEACGPLLGSLIYTRFGARWVFGVLAILSIVNQVLLFQVFFWVRNETVSRRKSTDSLSELPAEAPLRRLWRLISHRRLVRPCVLIAVSALVKGSLEEMIPYFTDHEWQYTVFDTGISFTYIAVAYILSAIAVGYLWTMVENFPLSRDLIVMVALVLLGLVGMLMFQTYAAHGRPENGVGTRGRDLFTITLVIYGITLGFTHTPAAFYLGEYVEALNSSAANSAANALWNAVWEFGGSLGFLLAALGGTSYEAESRLMQVLAVFCVIGAAIIWFLSNQKKAASRDLVQYSTFA